MKDTEEKLTELISRGIRFGENNPYVDKAVDDVTTFIDASYVSKESYNKLLLKFVEIVKLTSARDIHDIAVDILDDNQVAYNLNVGE